MKNIRQGLWLIALGISLLVVSVYVYADEPGDERGCYVTYNSNSGQFLYEPFLRVQHQTDGEDGDPQVWGFRPWNLEASDKEGKTHPVNISESRYIKMGVNKKIPMSSPGNLKATRCPDVLWRQTTKMAEADR